MVQLKNETEALAISITKKSETPIKKTHTKPQETLELRLTKSKETLSFKSPMSIEGCWRFGWTSLKFYNSIFNVTEEKIKFEFLYKSFWRTFIPII